MGIFDNLRGKPRPRASTPRRPGRPKGARNKPKPAGESPSLAAVVDRHLTKLHREDREAYREAVMQLVATYAETVMPPEAEDPVEMFQRLKREYAERAKLFGRPPTPAEQLMESAMQMAGEILKANKASAAHVEPPAPTPPAKPTAAPAPTDPWAALAKIGSPPMDPPDEGRPPE